MMNEFTFTRSETREGNLWLTLVPCSKCGKRFIISFSGWHMSVIRGGKSGKGEEGSLCCLPSQVASFPTK